jgi:ABC-type Fe3+ transport system permease subunit
MLFVVVVLEGFSIPALLGLPDQIFVFSSLIQHSWNRRQDHPTTARQPPTAC